MNTQVIFKVDKKMKERAQKQAKIGGFSLSDYFRFTTKSLAEGKTAVSFVQEEKFNAKTAREIRQALKDIKEGKNLSPAFKTVEEMKKYLMS